MKSDVHKVAGDFSLRLWRQYLATVLSDTWFKPEAGLQQKTSPNRSPLGQASSHTHPSHTAFPPRNPFSNLTSPTGQAQSRAPYSKGRVLRPEAGSRKWGCEDVFRERRRPACPVSWSRCTNKRTSEGCVGERAGLGPGGGPWGSGPWRLPLWRSSVSAMGCSPSLSP